MGAFRRPKGLPMTEAEQAKLKQCSHRLAELLYKGNSKEGRPISSLAMTNRVMTDSLWRSPASFAKLHP